MNTPNTVSNFFFWLLFLVPVIPFFIWLVAQIVTGDAQKAGINPKGILVSFGYAILAMNLLFFLWKNGIIDTDTLFGILVPPYIMTVGLVYMLTDVVTRKKRKLTK